MRFYAEKGPFPNEKYSKMQNSPKKYDLIVIPKFEQFRLQKVNQYTIQSHILLSL
jgi:hypothetical protein